MNKRKITISIIAIIVVIIFIGIITHEIVLEIRQSNANETTEKKEANQETQNNQVKDNEVTQNTDINTDDKKEFSDPELYNLLKNSGVKGIYYLNIIKENNKYSFLVKTITDDYNFDDEAKEFRGTIGLYCQANNIEGENAVIETPDEDLIKVYIADDSGRHFREYR